jgi:CHAD domain-containing protein
VPEARVALVRVRARVGSWTVKGRDRAVLHEGLARTRRQARRMMAAAHADPTVEAMHDWRKRVKDGWYQARLLTPVRPGVLGPFAEAVGVLGEDLGDHHDLAVLAEHLAALPPGPHAAAVPQMLARIGAAQTDLEARIFPAGAILLADKPGALAARWTGWWRDWRD